MFYFCKMQGTGNDFIIINYLKEKFEYSFKLLAEYLCDRHYGVGADGLIVLDKSDVADFKMRIFNSDGSEAEMCGNGIRCLAKYVYEHNFIDKKLLNIETKAGVKSVVLEIEGKKVSKVKVEIGEPIFQYEKMSVVYGNLRKTSEIFHDDKIDLQLFKKKSIKIDGMEFYYISIGNPHAVCFVENLDEIQIKEIGKNIENNKFFPNRINVEFVKIIDNQKIKIRVWERGVGETLSCGTGACAATVVSHLVKSTNSELIVDLKGGILKVSYDLINKKVFLEGEAEEVFEGKLNI